MSQFNEDMKKILDYKMSDPKWDTQDYLALWNDKHNIERQEVLDYAADKLAIKVAHSNFCLEAFK